LRLRLESRVLNVLGLTNHTDEHRGPILSQLLEV